jgi:hypothetical protein
MRPLLLALVFLVLAPAAQAATLDDAARALRSDPVFVDPSAELADQVDAGALRARIQAADPGPMYVAVLPRGVLREAGGSIDGALSALHEATGRRGTYALVAGGDFRAGSNTVRGAGDEATSAINAHIDEGPQATLLAFIDGVAERRDGAGSGGGGSGEGIGAGGAVVLVALLGLAGAALLLRGRSRRREQAAELAEVKENARDDLVALGDDIRALDLDVQMPDASQAARDDYGRAVEAYQRADDAWERARRPEDLEPVSAALEEGRWAMASAKARLAGREPPERRPPCFFDPRHGPSSRDVEWAPPGGEPRPVPACEADAQRVERGDDPEAREVMLGGRRMPYWQAGPAYAPFAGGFFGGFGGGLLPGVLVGTMLGGAMGGWGAQDAQAGGGDFGGDFGGGDFGGGDFGGGGGDFGGGDFGG